MDSLACPDSGDTVMLAGVMMSKARWHGPAASWVAVVTLGWGACVAPSLWAQEPTGSSDASSKAVESTGLNPANLPASIAVNLQQAKFATGSRLRAALFQGTYRFGPDYVRALIPVFDRVPGMMADTHATGLGDIRLTYFRIFCILTLTEHLTHGIGGTLQLDTATDSTLGTGTTTFEPFYAIDYQPTFNSALTFVARYIRDIGAGFATPLQDTVLLAPIAIVVFPRLWYASARVNNFIDLLSGPNTFTGRITGGKLFARHYNVGLFYEFPLTEESRVLNIQARFGITMQYLFN